MSALREAYELVKDESRWCRGSLATDAEGVGMSDVSDPEAVKFCAAGALVKSEATDADISVANSAATVLFPAFTTDMPLSHGPIVPGPFWAIIRVNDYLGHEAICQVFEKALVEREGGL
jgi:hypothetical protein